MLATPIPVEQRDEFLRGLAGASCAARVMSAPVSCIASVSRCGAASYRGRHSLGRRRRRSGADSLPADKSYPHQKNSRAMFLTAFWRLHGRRRVSVLAICPWSAQTRFLGRSARRKLLILLARPKGFEPLTPKFVVWCSFLPEPTIAQSGARRRRHSPHRGRGGDPRSADTGRRNRFRPSQAVEFANPKNPHCFPMATL